MHLLSQNAHLDDEIDIGDNSLKKVRDILVHKHPPSEPVHYKFVVQDDPQSAHPVIFESLDTSCIRSAALYELKELLDFQALMD